MIPDINIIITIIAINMDDGNNIIFMMWCEYGKPHHISDRLVIMDNMNCTICQ